MELKEAVRKAVLETGNINVDYLLFTVSSYYVGNNPIFSSSSIHPQLCFEEKRKRNF